MKIIIEIKPTRVTHCIGCICMQYKYPHDERNIEVRCSAFGKILLVPEQDDYPLRLPVCKAAEEEYNRLYEISKAASDFAVSVENL